MPPKTLPVPVNQSDAPEQKAVPFALKERARNKFGKLVGTNQRLEILDALSLMRQIAEEVRFGQRLYHRVLSPQSIYVNYRQCRGGLGGYGVYHMDRDPGGEGLRRP